MGMEMIAILAYGQPVVLIALLVLTAVQSVMINNLSKLIEEMKSSVVYQENYQARHDAINERVNEIARRVTILEVHKEIT